jgi:anti-sigma regulatory factor (Ser/Thr protein kinase)
MEVHLPSDPQRLPEVRERVRGWLAQDGWSEKQIGEIVLAVDEALSNVIRHGYGGRCDQQIHLHLGHAPAANGTSDLEVRIRDHSERVDLSRICGRDLHDVRPGGLGVHLINAMMESVEYSHAPGGGLLLVMRKSRTHVASTAQTEGDAS